MAGVCPYSSSLRKAEVVNWDGGKVGTSSASVSTAGLQRSKSEGLEGHCGPTAGTGR